jgi:hypothetical protein
MSYRSLVLAAAAVSSLHVASAHAQSVYVAPGGVYIGGGPVYVTPAPNIAPAPYAAPSYGPPAVVAPPVVAPTAAYGYGPPAVVGPPVVAPTAIYEPGAGYGGYGGYGGYYEGPLSDYAAAPPPRPPVGVPYGSVRCGARYGYSGQTCY